jgi:O-antigen ligase
VKTGWAVMAAWLIYFTFAPTVGFRWGSSWHNEQRAMQLVLLALSCFVAALFSMSRRRSDGQVSPHPLLTTALLLGAASAALAEFPSAGFQEVALASALAGSAILAAQIAKANPRRWATWVSFGAFVASSAYIAGVTTNYLTALSLGQSIDVEVVMLGYRNPRFPSATHAVLIPLVLWLVIAPDQRRLTRVAAFAIASCLWAINLALGTRGIWVAVALAGISLGWLDNKSIRKLTGLLALSASAGVLLYYALFLTVPATHGTGETLQSRSQDIGSLSKREQLWHRAAVMTLERPLLGFGPMHFATDPPLEFAHPHNWMLQVSSEWGLPALVFAACLLGAVLVRCARRLRSPGQTPEVKDRVAPFAMALAVALIYGLFDGNWVMPVSQSLNVLVLGSVVGLTHESGGQGGRLISATTTTAFAMAALWLLWTASIGLPHQATAEEAYRAHSGQIEFAPRFWQQGYINVSE